MQGNNQGRKSTLSLLFLLAERVNASSSLLLLQIILDTLEAVGPPGSVSHDEKQVSLYALVMLLFVQLHSREIYLLAFNVFHVFFDALTSFGYSDQTKLPPPPSPPPATSPPPMCS